MVNLKYVTLPTADLILLSLTVALLFPWPRRPCSLLTCLVTPCLLVLTRSITVVELGVWAFFFFTLLLSRIMHTRRRENKVFWLNTRLAQWKQMTKCSDGKHLCWRAWSTLKTPYHDAFIMIMGFCLFYPCSCIISACITAFSFD